MHHKTFDGWIGGGRKMGGLGPDFKSKFAG